MFGYDVFDLPEAQDARHLILASENYSRASVNPIPPAWTAATPRWLNFIRVDDATATSARVTALGGRVVQPPRVDRQGGKIAVMADPAGHGIDVEESRLGAAFGLMEWPEDAPAGTVK